MDLSEIFKIKDKQEALLWKELYIKELIDISIKQNSSIKSYDHYLQIANSNIGYFSGYSSNRGFIEELFDVKHPIFGSVKENGTPSPEECIKLGFQLGKKYGQNKKRI